MFWALVIGSEVLFWLLLGGFAFTRYWYGRRKMSLWFLVGVLVNEVWLVPFAVWDAVTNGRFSIFHADVIFEAAALPVILLVAGRRFFQKLDSGAEKYVARVRRISVDEVMPPQRAAVVAVVRLLRERDDTKAGSEHRRETNEKVSDIDHAERERRGWYVHLAIFVVGQGLIQLAFFTGLLAPTDGLFFGNGSNSPIGIGPIEIIPNIAGLRRAWSVILILDFIWSFSYTLRPKEKSTEESGSKSHE